MLIEDGSCYPYVFGCLDSTYYNYNDYDYDGHPNELQKWWAWYQYKNFDDCIDFIYGCTDNGSELNGLLSVNRYR